MTEMTDSTFRTKTGTCCILPDRILIRREGVSGFLANMISGNSVIRTLFVNSIISLSLVCLAGYLVVNGQISIAILPFVIALFLLYGTIKSRDFSAIPEIPRDAIETIEAHEPRPGATRGYFLVHFRLGESVKKRIIILPGSMSGGSTEFKRALDLLRNHGLINDATTPNTC